MHLKAETEELSTQTCKKSIGPPGSRDLGLVSMDVEARTEDSLARTWKL